MTLQLNFMMPGPFFSSWMTSLSHSYSQSLNRNILCTECKLKNRLYLLIGLTDDLIRESLRHLAGSVLGSLQGMIQVALRGGGYHCRNKRSDSSCCLSAKQDRRREISPIKLLLGGEMRHINTKQRNICLTVNQRLQIKVLIHHSAAHFVKNLY